MIPVILPIAFPQRLAVNRNYGTAATDCESGDRAVKKLLVTFGAAIIAITLLTPVTAEAKTHKKNHHKSSHNKTKTHHTGSHA